MDDKDPFSKGRTLKQTPGEAVYNKGDNLPVENVSWNDVQEFIGRSKEKTGKNYRLPAETEWEYAARGGNGTPGNYTYAGSNNAGEVAWYGLSWGGSTKPVGTKAPNGLGIYDMSGNVWEWCWDWYGSYPSMAQTDPTGASSGSNRVRRGGDYQGGSVRSAFRSSGVPSWFTYVNGFRLVRP